jgi:hypothetical protein
MGYGGGSIKMTVFEKIKQEIMADTMNESLYKKGDFTFIQSV